MLSSGLFDWVKAVEVVIGVTVLLNRAMPLTIMAIVPLTVVIVYWNCVLNGGAFDWEVAAFTVVSAAFLGWPWRRYFWPLFVWRGLPEYSLKPRVDRSEDTHSAM